MRIACMFLVAASLLSDSLLAQQRPQEYPQRPICPPTHLRFTARQYDGTPVAGLKPGDIRIWLGTAPGYVLSLNSDIGTKAAVPDTNILFVVPPFFRLDNYSIEQLIAAIRQADNFRIVAAVLAPDGKTTPFSSDAEKLDAALRHAISSHSRHSDRNKWPFYEEEAFVKLRDLPGRHVLVNLQDPANPFRSLSKAAFIADRTLERLALFDGSQVYGLVTPVPSDAAIPMGDASAIHSDIGPENHGAEQLQQIQESSKEQSSVWTQEDANNNITGGRSDVTVNALLSDILQDAPGSYDSVVQPTISCTQGRIYSANVTSSMPRVRLFGPNAIQVIPVAGR